jgi:hypothetical protein
MFLKNFMRHRLFPRLLMVSLSWAIGPLWAQDIQKLLLHEGNNQTAIEIIFLPGNRFDMQVIEAKGGSLNANTTAKETIHGSTKRVAERLELSVDGRSIGYVQLWSGKGNIQAQLYWGGQTVPRAFFGAAFR